MEMTPVCLIYDLDVSVEFESGVDYFGIESILLLAAQTMQSAFAVKQNDSLYQCLTVRVDLELEGIEFH